MNDFLLEHSAILSARFENVLTALRALTEHLNEILTTHPFWVDDGNRKLVQDRSQLLKALQLFEPQPGLAPEETYVCPGAVGCVLETLELLKEVNAAKIAFKSAVQDYQQSSCYQHAYPARKILAKAGYGLLRLKQIYRQINFIDWTPRRIAWTFARNGSHVVISLKEAEKLLRAKGEGEHIEAQLNQLKKLRPKERLVIHHAMKAYAAVNVSTFHDETGRSLTRKVHTSLPLFYLVNPKLPAPVVAYSRKTARKNAAQRADKQLEEIPFLPSIHAYRYRRR